jgi:hypothetical protein
MDLSQMVSVCATFHHLVNHTFYLLLDAFKKSDMQPQLMSLIVSNPTLLQQYMSMMQNQQQQQQQLLLNVYLQQMQQQQQQQQLLLLLQQLQQQQSSQPQQSQSVLSSFSQNLQNLSNNLANTATLLSNNNNSTMDFGLNQPTNPPLNNQELPIDQIQVQEKKPTLQLITPTENHAGKNKVQGVSINEYAPPQDVPTTTTIYEFDEDESEGEKQEDDILSPLSDSVSSPELSDVEDEETNEGDGSTSPVIQATEVVHPLEGVEAPVSPSVPPTNAFDNKTKDLPTRALTQYFRDISPVVNTSMRLNTGANILTQAVAAAVNVKPVAVTSHPPMAALTNTFYQLPTTVPSAATTVETGLDSKGKRKRTPAAAHNDDYAYFLDTEELPDGDDDENQGHRKYAAREMTNISMNELIHGKSAASSNGMKISFYAWDGMLIDQLRHPSDPTKTAVPTLQEWVTLFHSKPLLTEYEFTILENLAFNPAMEQTVVELIKYALHFQKKHDLSYKQTYGWGYLKEQLTLGRSSMLCTVFWTTYVIYLYHHPQYQQFKIPTIQEFKEKYIDSTHHVFAAIDTIELNRLYLFANFLLIAFYIVPAYRNEVLLLKMAAAIERSGKKYQISTSGQMIATTRRRMIYRKLSGIIPHSPSTGASATCGSGPSSALASEHAHPIEGIVLSSNMVIPGENKRRRATSLPPTVPHPALVHGLPDNGVPLPALSPDLPMRSNNTTSMTLPSFTTIGGAPISSTINGNSATKPAASNPLIPTVSQQDMKVRNSNTYTQPSAPSYLTNPAFSSFVDEQSRVTGNNARSHQTSPPQTVKKSSYVSTGNPRGRPRKDAPPRYSFPSKTQIEALQREHERHHPTQYPSNLVPTTAQSMRGLNNTVAPMPRPGGNGPVVPSLAAAQRSANVVMTISGEIIHDGRVSNGTFATPNGTTSSVPDTTSATL